MEQPTIFDHIEFDDYDEVKKLLKSHSDIIHQRKKDIFRHAPQSHVEK
ncbi:hypothetical protein ACFL0U_01045 [Pseudomonadota bacterium]